MLNIVTRSGRVLPKDQCALINNEWYKKGNRKVQDSGEAYKVGMSYYPADKFYWDVQKKQYYRLTDNIVLGFIDNMNVLGHFKKGEYTAKIVDSPYYLNDYRKFKEMYYHGRYNAFTRMPNPAYVKNYKNFNTRLYGADNNDAFDMARLDYQDKANERTIPELFDYTFGVEFETADGSLHDKMLQDNFLIPVRDGSIDGYEYISVPMQKELDTLKAQCHYLSRQCTVNKKTSTHIHIGNLPRTKEFALSFYILMYRFQNEINAMFPPLKKHLRALDDYGNREAKDYCKFLPEINLMYGKNYVNEDGEFNQEEIDEAYEDLWTFWNDGERPCDDHNPENRRHHKTGMAKWNYVNRYSIVNMNNYFFTSSRTIEFRYHEGTLNFGKISNWILLNVAFVKYAKNNAAEILSSNTKITFKDILSELDNDDLESHLIDYIYKRKAEMSKYYAQQNPFFRIFELDKTYNCTWQNLK